MINSRDYFPSNFEPANFDPAKKQSIKLKDGKIVESNVSEGNLQIRKILHKITFGVVALNPKLDKAINAITTAIRQHPDFFAKEPGIANKMQALINLSSTYGSRTQTGRNLNDAVRKMHNELHPESKKNQLKNPQLKPTELEEQNLSELSRLNHLPNAINEPLRAEEPAMQPQPKSIAQKSIGIMNMDLLLNDTPSQTIKNIANHLSNEIKIQKANSEILFEYPSPEVILLNKTYIMELLDQLTSNDNWLAQCLPDDKKDIREFTDALTANSKNLDPTLVTLQDKIKARLQT
jgi:hypothetical protein